MGELLKSALGQFRIVSLAEGTSYIILLFIAMPLKYMADMPGAVSIVGRIHGFLFIVFMIALLRVWVEADWKMGRALLAFVASIVPFGAFLFEVSLKKEWHQTYGEST
ncbi:DUF3817 domain-containing protein [Acanthopleuribacter pedis]|uniref:DUF3817 domain-containing protein n=1 Tax=Acanthopleuribacter pedis TaxID=442870 RepID=A0A8J7Q310_9BACT|nr:DUF3817 domain-containing protein [Acanthopleuribacter pedis]MBO1319597.1 DUF3817 domain-containing protein [Acanthopleuribacter pedis]